MEVCLISSLMLHLIEFSEHPANLFEKLHELEVSINPDNPGVWGTTMQTHELIVAISTLLLHPKNGVHIEQLYKWQISAIDHSFMTEDEKTQAKKLFIEKWNTFINEIAADQSYDQYNSIHTYSQPAIQGISA